MFGPEGLEVALRGGDRSSEVSGAELRNYYVAESSYMAAPFIGCGPVRDAKVIHLVRNPLKVILSFHNNLQYWHGRPNKWERFILQHVDLTGTPLEQCCKYVVKWNRMIEPQAHYRVRLEDGPSKALRIVGVDRDVTVAPANGFDGWEQKKPPLPLPATEKDILNGSMGSEVKLLMNDYGY